VEQLKAKAGRSCSAIKEASLVDPAGTLHAGAWAVKDQQNAQAEAPTYTILAKQQSVPEEVGATHLHCPPSW